MGRGFVTAISREANFSYPHMPVKQLLRNLTSHWGGMAAALYLRQATLALNTRIAYYDISVDPARHEYSEHCIHVFWHEFIVLAVGHFSYSPVTMLVSQHRDADWLTQSAAHLGFQHVRGSTTRGGSAAIRQLKRSSKITSIGITPDGPRGPRRQMAMGPIFLASLLRMPIVPVGFGYERPWRLNTWDRFAIPKPWSRGRIIMGPKIVIPPKLAREQMEDYRRAIEQMTNDLTAVAEDWAFSGKQLAKEYPAVKHRRATAIQFADSTRRNRRKAKPGRNVLRKAA